ncbi:MAG: hypothetical protein ABI333_16860 [bacterium]
MSKLVISLLSVAAAAGLLAAGCGDDSGGDNNNTPQMCGNGVIEGTEACDGSELGGQNCGGLGYVSGTLTCRASCTFDETLCEGEQCGNDRLETGEQCDGLDMGYATCQSRGFTGGTLACTATCLIDESGCNDNCGNGDIDPGEVCDGNNFDGETCATQPSFDGGTLSCNYDCTALNTDLCCVNTCTTDGESECVGNTLRTCQAGAGGCLRWFELNCASGGQICDDSGATAQCIGACTSNCTTLDALQCNGADIEICVQNGICLNWATDSDCGAGNTCVEMAVPTCVTLGERCEAAQMITALPFTINGTDFTADYTDDHDFNGTGCDTGNGAEAVFSIDLLTGEQIKLDHTGGMDAVIRVLATCDATAGECLVDEDLQETNIFFTAPADGTYYIVLEAYLATPSTTDYDFTVQAVMAEDCGDGVDNDLDGDVDCGDSDCFGDSTHCATETLCNDGLDNDADNDTDCVDSDCSGLPICGGGTLIFSESFSATDIPPAGWTLEDGGSDGLTWQHCDGCAGAGSTPVTLTNATGGYVFADDDSADDMTTEGLVTGAINCAAYTQVALRFVHYFRSWLTSSGAVEVSTDGGNNFTQVALYGGTSTGNGDTVALDLSALAAGQADVRIRFVYDEGSGYAYYWLLDTIEVFAQ